MSSPLLFLGYTYIQNRRPCIQVIGLAIYLFWLFPCIFVTQEIFDLLVRRATLLSCHYKKHLLPYILTFFELCCVSSREEKNLVTIPHFYPHYFLLVMYILQFDHFYLHKVQFLLVDYHLHSSSLSYNNSHTFAFVLSLDVSNLQVLNLL